jgi:uncharacterized membrane protein
MSKTRMEAFSDGVIAILITIMVLEMRAPHSTHWVALKPILPIFISYLLSFFYIAVYWNNHHHLLQAIDHVNGHILWANMHLLFWLSLFPFVTDWVGENTFATEPMALYGFVLLMAGFAYRLLSRELIRHHPDDSKLRKAVGTDCKGTLSIAIYAAAILLAFLNPWISFALYTGVALMWFLPDRRIEKVLGID